MTKKEMVEKYMAAKGYNVIEGEITESIEPLMPYLLMDLQNDLFQKFIKPISCKHELKKHRNTWYNNYYRFNDHVFNAFKGDDKGAVIDYMDDFEEFMQNDIVILRLAVMEQIPTDNIEHKKVISAAYTCLVLATIAKTIHQKVFQRAVPLTKWHRKHGYFTKYIPEKTTEIDAVIQSVTEWIQRFVADAGICNIKTSDKIRAIQETICKKIARWFSN